MSIAGAYGGAREPTTDEWAGIHSLGDILTWARLTGTMDYGPSQQGSLLIALGGDMDTSIDEFASISVPNFFNTIETVWLHSESTVRDDYSSQDLVIKPSDIVKARAGSAHHVARIWIGSETTRAY